MELDDESNFYEHPQRASKTSQKRESEALQNLGETLIELPNERLTQLDLPLELLDAVNLARSITAHHGAFKRQRKYIGKLLREIDATPIKDRIAGFDRQSAEAIHAQHQIERWRDRLLAGNDHEINSLMAEYPQADRQKLRHLTREGRREHEQNAPPRSARLLFKYLRELLNQ